jgi:hypothetical protein
MTSGEQQQNVSHDITISDAYTMQESKRASMLRERNTFTALLNIKSTLKAINFHFQEVCL